jgi:outer membrane receptor protein involved in Fe transport
VLDDAIANITMGAGPGQFPGVGFVGAGGSFRRRGNLDSIRAQGIELEAGLTMARWSLTASYAHVDAKVRASGVAAPLDGLRPAQTPRHQASATLGWSQAQGPRASVTLRYVGAQFEDDQNSRVLRNAFTMDAAALVPLASDFALELRAENLADARVEAGVSGVDLVERATPRTLWVGLRYGATRN